MPSVYVWSDDLPIVIELTDASLGDARAAIGQMMELGTVTTISGDDVALSVHWGQIRWVASSMRNNAPKTHEVVPLAYQMVAELVMRAKS